MPPSFTQAGLGSRRSSEPLARIAAWLGLALVFIATVSPLAMRPHLADPRLEYVAAMTILGALFAFAYPKRPVLLAIVLLAVVVLLELSQLVTGDRHARLGDLAFKALGAGVGLVAGLLLARLVPRP